MLMAITYSKAKTQTFYETWKLLVAVANNKQTLSIVHNSYSPTMNHTLCECCIVGIMTVWG